MSWRFAGMLARKPPGALVTRRYFKLNLVKMLDLSGLLRRLAYAAWDALALLVPARWFAQRVRRPRSALC